MEAASQQDATMVKIRLVDKELQDTVSTMSRWYKNKGLDLHTQVKRLGFKLSLIH